jgi:uncharacterized protein
MRLVVAVLSLLVVSPAFAQNGPSFDCAKADNAIDRAICKEPELAKADREMAAVYGALLGKLNAVAKDELVKDQAGWIAGRNQGCRIDPQGPVSCLKSRYALRIATLRAYGDGSYPFISEHSLIKAGKLGAIAWSYDISYPRFDGTTADFSALNARFSDEAKKAASNATPNADAGPDRKQEWTYSQSFGIKRAPGGNTATVAMTFWGYSGGAHGYGATHCTLVDLRTGKAVGPQGVFAPGEQWLRAMSQLVGADLRKQFVDKPGFEEALEPAKLAKLLSEAGRYCWTADGLDVIFNAYDVGPYSSGPYDVEIAYDRLKPLLRPDGPIAR